jgi:hypothetical protein
VLLAPLTGEMVAALLDGDGDPPSVLAPERFTMARAAR